ncbi:MAG: putative Ig domain-containing protein, partial [Magnetococcales bacterium]|nr:putative Ig domain-containing protein [Magnetococcales bacterium]
MSTPHLTQGISLHQDVTTSHAAHGVVLPMEGEALLPQASIFLEGEFAREGDHLLITAPDGERFVIHGYFGADTPPILTAPNGAFLLPETVSLLLPLQASGLMVAGPVPTPGEAAPPGATPAAAPAASGGAEIGKVKGITGAATVRNQGGASRDLKVGDAVFEGEEVKTADGGQVQLEFVDGTQFQVGAAARVVINKFLFNPAAGQGEFGATVMKGAFSYASGKLAQQHSGRHTLIKTPTAQIGVRGSKFQGNVGEDGKTDLLHNEGVIDVSDKNGNGTVTLLEPGTATVVTLDGGPSPAFVASQEFMNRLKSLLPTVAPSQNQQQDTHIQTNNAHETALVQNILDGYKDSNLNSGMVKGTLGINLERMTEAERHEFVSDLSQLAQQLPPLPAPNLSVSQGVFLDSAVQGIRYRTASFEGVTDSSGGFSYKPGETVTFSIGGVVIGTVTMGASKDLPIVTPTLLAQAMSTSDSAKENAVVNIVRLLQTLDDDGDPSNGINLGNADEIQASSIDFTVAPDDFASNDNVKGLVKTVTRSESGALVSQEQAMQHYTQTLTMLETLQSVTVDTASFLYASEGRAFSFVLPAGTFKAPNGAAISYRIIAPEGQIVPPWLSFSSNTLTLANKIGMLPDDADVGSSVLKIQATIIGSNASAGYVNYILMVQNVNDTPELSSAITTQSADSGVGGGLLFNAGSHFRDADTVHGDQMTFTATLDGAVLASDSWLHLSNGVLSSSATELVGHAGKHTIVMTATDKLGAFTSTTFDLVVDNHAPVAASDTLTAQNAAQGSAFSFVVPSNQFSDQDITGWGDSVTYTARVGGQVLAAPGNASNHYWLKFDPATRTFSGTPAAMDINNNALSVTVTVTDQAGETAQSNFQLTVSNGNDAPIVVHAIEDHTVTQESSFNFSIPFNTFGDVDAAFGDTLTYTATLQDGSALPSWLNFDADTRTFYGMASSTDHTVEVKVTAHDHSVDPAGVPSLSVSDTFVLNVRSLNTAPQGPSAAWNNLTVSQGQALQTFQIPASDFTDVDVGDTLTYSAQLISGAALPPWLVFNPSTRTFSGTPANGDVGVWTVQVKATDQAGVYADSSFQIAVNNVNDAPTRFGEGLVSKLASVSGAPITLFDAATVRGDFRDMDLNIAGSTEHLTYTVSLQDGSALPSWLHFGGSENPYITANPSVSDLGMLVALRITATDSGGLSAVDNLLILVTKPNLAPLFDVANPIAAPAADKNPTQGLLFLYEVPVTAFTDPDLNDKLVFSATLAGGAALPSWLSFDADTHTLIGKPGNADVGELHIRLTATDWAGASVHSNAFVLTVANVNDAPILKQSIGSKTQAIGSTFSSFSVASYFYDADVEKNYTIPVSGTPVHDTLSYSYSTIGTALPNWISFDSATGTFSSTHALTDADKGTYTVKVTATDQAGVKASDIFNIVVRAPNTAPVFNTAKQVAPQEVAQGSSLFLSLDKTTFTDADVGDKLTWSASLSNGTNLPNWLTFDPLSLTFIGTPHNADVAALSIVVKATDRDGASAQETFTLKVNNVNDAPILNKEIPNQYATIGKSGGFSYTVDVNAFTDVDMAIDPTARLTLSAKLVDGSALPSWLNFDAATRTFSGIPPTSASGTLAVKVTATDNAATNPLSASDIFNISINHAPTAAAPTVTVAKHGTQGSSFFFKLPSNTFQDADSSTGDALTLTATRADGSALPSWLIFNAGSGTFVGTPANNDVGTLEVKVTATDRANAQISTQLSIVVDNVNDAPTVAAKIGERWVDVNSTGSGSAHTLFQLNLGSIFQDPDALIDPTKGGKLTYTATLLGTGGGDLANAATSWFRFDASTGTFLVNEGKSAPATATDYTIKVTATDGYNLSVSDVLTLHVMPPSTLHVANAIVDQSAIQDKAWFFTLPATTFADTAGYPVTLSATLKGGAALPSWLSFDADSGSFYGKPSSADLANLNISGQQATMEITVTATDPRSAVVSDTFILSIQNANDAPVINRASPVTVPVVTQGVAFQFVIPKDHFTDVDALFGDTLAYSATLSGGGALPSWLQFDAATRRFYTVENGPPLDSVLGEMDIRITATDLNGNGLSVSDIVTLNILAPNNAPTLASHVDSFSQDVGATLSRTLAGTFQDLDGSNTLTYKAEWLHDGVSTDLGALSNSSWLHFDATTRTLFGTPEVQVVNGTDPYIQNDTGVWKIKLTATDSRGASVSDLFDITVVNPVGNDHGPVLVKPVSEQTNQLRVVKGSDFFLQLDAQMFLDPDSGDTITVSVPEGDLPSWLHFDQETGVFSGTAPESSGVANIRIIASSNGQEAYDLFTLQVVDSNSAPTVATPLTVDAVNQGDPILISFASIFQDSDLSGGDSLTYTLTLANGSALPENYWLTLDTDSLTISGVAGNDQVGSWDLRLVATDSLNSSAATTFTVQVNNVNDAPVVHLDLQNQGVVRGSAFTYRLPSNTFTDVDKGDTLTVTATSLDGSALPSWLHFDAATQTFSGTPGTNVGYGYTYVKVTASDGALSVSDSFRLQVAESLTGIFLDSKVVGISYTTKNAAGVVTHTGTTNDKGEFQYDSSTDTVAFSIGGISLGQTTVDGVITPVDLAGKSNLVAITNMLRLLQSVDSDGNAENGIEIDSGVLSGSAGKQLDFNLTVDSFTAAASSYLNSVGKGSTVVTADAAWKHFLGTLSGLSSSTGGIYGILNTSEDPYNPVAVQGMSFSYQVPQTLFSISGGVKEWSISTLDKSALPSWLKFDKDTGLFSGTPGNSDVGSVALLVTAKSGSVTSSEVIDFTILNSNDAPIYKAGSLTAQKATWSQAFQYQVPGDAFSDADVTAKLGDTLTYSAVLMVNGAAQALPSWLTFDGETGTLFGTATAQNSTLGNVVLKVTAADTMGASASALLDLSVLRVNATPTVVTPVGNKSATEGSSFFYQLPANAFSDADMATPGVDALTYTARLSGSGAGNLPSWLHFDADTRSFSGTPTRNDTGSLNIKITATDQAGAKVSDVFLLDIKSIAHAPSINPNKTITSQLTGVEFKQNESLRFALDNQTFLVDAGDKLVLSAQLSDGRSLSSVGLQFDGSSATFTGKPTVGETLHIVLTALDDTNKLASTTQFDLTVKAVNHAPTIDNTVAWSAPNAKDDSTAFTYTIPTGRFTDQDGDMLHYTISTLTGAALPEWLSFSGTTLSSVDGKARTSGSIGIKITATDSGGLSVSDTFTLTVEHVNRAPTVDTTLLGNKSFTQGAAFTYQLNAKAFTDADTGDKLTYTATLQSGAALPSGLVFDANTRSFIVQSGNTIEVGTYDIKVTATDLAGANVTGNFNISVAALNHAPTRDSSVTLPKVVSIVEGTTSAGSLNSLPLTTLFKDVDTSGTLGTLALSVTGAPSWLVFDPTTATFSTTSAAQVGSYVLRLTATDGGGLTVSDAFTLNVTILNRAPVAVQPGNYTVTEDQSFLIRLPATTFTDSNIGDRLTVTASLSDNSAKKKKKKKNFFFFFVCDPRHVGLGVVMLRCRYGR